MGEPLGETSKLAQVNRAKHPKDHFLKIIKSSSIGIDINGRQQGLLVVSEPVLVTLRSFIRFLGNTLRNSRPLSSTLHSAVARCGRFQS